MELTQLIQAARRGDHAAYATVVQRFQDMAFGGAYARLGDVDQAQDAAQDAFIEAWQCLDSLREPAAFPGWFRRIVWKQVDRQLRARRPTVGADALDAIPSALPGPHALVEAGERVDAVRDAVAGLPESQRLPLTLFHLDGYSQREVAEFLELPISTVKKRIFDARKILHERMQTMVKDTLAEARPSRDETFARKVEFFVALGESNVAAMDRLLQQDTSLLEASADWDVAPDLRGLIGRVHAAGWAAESGNVEMLDMLLGHGVAIDGNGGDGLLHTTVMSGWPEATRLLLRRGADPSRPGGLRQTPLHRAVMRGEPELVEMLLEAGAELDSEDHRGRTPADWCVLKGRSALLEILTGRGARPSRVTSARPAGKASRRESRRVPTGDDALGRHLDAAGLPLDDGPAPVARTGVSAAADPARTPILETGIKIVDLFAPFPRGGHVGVRGGPGMGGLLLIEQISRNVVAEHGGRVVYAGYERGAPAREHLEWRSFVADGKLLSESSVHLLAAAGDHGRYRQTVESAVTVADRWRQDGHEVLLVVESLLTRADGVLPCLRGFPSVTADAAVTTLYKGSAALGVDDAGLFDALDAVISLDVRRADRARFPAVDPGASRSRLLDESLLPEEHRQLVGSVRDHIRYFYTHNLHAVFHDGRLQEAMLHTDDVEAAQRLIRRTNRLDLFLTQPYHGTEIWTGEPDETVSLAAALDGCRRILDGDFEDVRDDAFNMIGTVEQAPEKAERL